MNGSGTLLVRLLLLSVWLASCSWLAAQSPKPADPPKSAVRLPDGTVIFLSKSDDPNLPPDAVLLSPKEYQTLLEAAEQLKKLKDAPTKAIPPAKCQVQVKLEPRGPRTVAVLKFNISGKTIQPRTLISLGGSKAQAISAKLADGKLPLLLSQDDGLAILQEQPGTYAVELVLEAAVQARGVKGELGFEVGLPRAAITTLEQAAPLNINRGTLGLRSVDRPNELQSQPLDLPSKDYPLGAAEYLSLSWSPPATVAAPTVTAPTAEVDVIVRTEETSLETTAVIKLRGNAKEWSIQTPPGSEVQVQKLPTVSEAPNATWLTRPTDANKPIWLFRPPDGTDWTLTLSHRQTRPRSADPKFVGPYPIGPVSVLNATRQTGSLKFLAPRTIGLRFNKLAPEFRPQDVPTEEDLRAVYRFSTTTSTGPRPLAPTWLELEARTVTTAQRLQPTYSINRIESGAASGWRIQATLRVTPPLGGEVNEVSLEVPANWLGEEFGPLDLIGGTVEGPGTGSMKPRVLQLQTPQKNSFDVTLSAVVPAPLASGAASIPLPRFPKSLERDSLITVQVPEGLQLRGVGLELGPVAQSLPLQVVPGKLGQLQLSAEKSLARVDLTWQPYRPDLSVDSRAEITLQPRQMLVEQTLRLRTTEAEAKPFRLRGPDNATGWNLSAPVESLGPGEWLVRPPVEAKDWSFNISFAVPLSKSEATSLPVSLAWVELATRTDTQARIWGGGFPRRLTSFNGPWRELPPEPHPDKPAFPWLTLSATGTRVPLSLELGTQADTNNLNLVERTLVQAVLSDEGAVALRTRFLLKRWSPAGLDIELPPNTLPEVLIDGRRSDPINVSESAEGRVIRLAVPPPTNRRTTLLIEVMLTGGPRYPDRGECLFVPPKLLHAMIRTPPRWLILTPHEAIPLVNESGFQADTRWGWPGRWPAPVAANSSAELEQWLTGGLEPDKPDHTHQEGLAGRQPHLGTVQVWLVPRLWWISGCSLLGFVLAFGLSRVRRGLQGVALALLTACTTAGLLLAAQPTNWFLLGVLPGVLAAGAILLLEWLLHWYYLRRITNLPGFRRRNSEAELNLVPSPSATRAHNPRDGSGSQPLTRSGS